MGLFLNKRDTLQFNHISETFSLHGAVPGACFKTLLPNASVIKRLCYTPKVDKRQQFFSV